MSTRSQERKARDEDNVVVALVVAAAAGLGTVGPPALLAALALEPLAQRYRRELALAALGGLAPVSYTHLTLPTILLV